MRAGTFLAGAAAIALLPASALASAKLAVVADGPTSDKLALGVASSLPSGWSVDEGSGVAGELASHGVKSAAGSLAKPKERAQAIAKIRAAADASHDQAVLVLHVAKGPKGRKVTLVLVDATQAAPLLDTSVTLGVASAATDDDRVKAAFSPAIAKVTVPADQKPAPASTTTTTDTPSSIAAPSADAPAKDEVAPTTHGDARVPGSIARALFDVSVGFALSSRHFDYNDGITSNLRTYDVDGVPTVAAALEAYPLAGTSVPVLRDLGLVGDFTMAAGLDSATKNGPSVSTSWLRFDAGARYRVRFGNPAKPVIVGFSAAYGRESFTFSDSSISNELPSATYDFLRAKLDGRIPLGPLAVTLAAAYLPTLGADGTAPRFRESQVAGVEGALGVSVPFAHWLEARLIADYTRFFYAFKPVPGDGYVAGGALDQMFRGQLALAFLY